MKIVLAGITFLLIGCAGVSETRAPDGSIMKNVKCSSNSAKCFSDAAESCKSTSGSYRVVESHSNAGGVFADIFPGPVTWYNMTYICGPSDGVMPTFVLTSSAPSMPVMPEPSKPTTTYCNKLGSSINCTSY